MNVTAAAFIGVWKTMDTIGGLIPKIEAGAWSWEVARSKAAF